ncbi:MAG: NusG domain II-containing protein [Spirochaetales bacterium]|nr:NusG domain II-containing protein [Spirochaetales bacterium]
MLKKADIIIALVCVLTVAGLSLLILPSRAPAQNVIITCDGGRYIYQLGQDLTVSVPGPLGLTVIQISGSSVRVLSSPCPGGDCMRMSASKSGDFIACLPNRVMITIGGDGEVDDVAY